MIILAEIVIIISIIFANISGLVFAKKAPSKLICILISMLLLILLCIISFDDFVLIRDAVFVLVAFSTSILLVFFVPKNHVEKISAYEKTSIFSFVVILSAFFLFIYSLANIHDFHKVFLAKNTQDKAFVSSHFDDEAIKEFYLNKNNNSKRLLEKENIREFRFSDNKILKEKLTDNPLLYRFSEIVLLSSLFIIMLFLFANKRV